MAIHLYGIAHCETVKRARAWLDAHGIEARFHDFARDGVPEAAPARWLAAVGRERLLNRRGTTWRGLDAVLRAQADTDDGARRLLAQRFALIRRPVVEWPDGSVTAGFDAADWAQRATSG